MELKQTLDKAARNIILNKGYLIREPKIEVLFDTESAILAAKNLRNIINDPRFDFVITKDTHREINNGSFVKDRNSYVVNNKIKNLFNSKYINEIDVDINDKEKLLDILRLARDHSRKMKRQYKKDIMEKTDIGILYHAIDISPKPIVIFSEDSHILDTGKALKYKKGHSNLHMHSILDRYPTKEVLCV